MTISHNQGSENKTGYKPLAREFREWEMKTNETNLIERIQEHIEGATVMAARGLEIIGEGDEAVYPFAYSLDAAPGEMRGAFTNADPVWEEDDAEAFAELMGEMAA